MPSQRNIEYIKTTKERLKTGKAFYFTDFTGLSVQNLEKLRRSLKQNSGAYVVLKNTLGFLAMKDLGYNEKIIHELFMGPTGVAIAFEDPIVLAKILKETRDLKIKGCYIEGTFYDINEVTRLSLIPSKEVLLNTLVCSLNILGNLVGILESLIRNLTYTIDAIKKNKEEK
jgi:large subunit ribosomal protein L10